MEKNNSFYFSRFKVPSVWMFTGGDIEGLEFVGELNEQSVVDFVLDNMYEGSGRMKDTGDTEQEKNDGDEKEVNVSYTEDKKIWAAHHENIWDTIESMEKYNGTKKDKGKKNNENRGSKDVQNKTNAIDEEKSDDPNWKDMHDYMDEMDHILKTTDNAEDKDKDNKNIEERPISDFDQRQSELSPNETKKESGNVSDANWKHMENSLNEMNDLLTIQAGKKRNINTKRS